MARDSKNSDSKNDDLVDSIYAVAMEPERFRELVDSWHQVKADIEESSPSEHNHDSALLEKHIDRAETILSLVMANEDLLPTPLQEKLNSEPQSLLAFTEDGTIEALNHAAKTQFGISEGDGVGDLPISENSKLIVKKEINRLARTDVVDMGDVPALFSLTKSDGSSPVFVTFSSWVTSGGRRFVLLKTTDFVWPEPLTPLIKKAFNLTQAESGIVKLIVGGNSPEDIAKIRSTSIKTVRSQIRSLYAKTSTRNQSDFIRLALGLTTLQLVNKGVLNGVYQRPPLKTALPLAYPLPEHRRLLSLPDGRILDYAVFGPEDGIPCVFFHNEYFGDVWPPQLAQYALQKKLRIIAPARAYYARSSPYPKGVISYEQFSADLTFLLDELDIARAVLISQTFGSMFSLAFAGIYKQRTAAIVAVAPVLPFSSPADEKNMPKFPRFMANIVTRHPQMLKFIFKSGVIYHNRVGSLRFLETLIANTQPDIEIIKDPKNVHVIIQGFQYSKRNGHLGFYHDYRHLIENPRQKIIQLECPIYTIIGTDDKNTRASRAEGLIAAGANMQKIMAKDGGEMLFFSHPELIVDTLVDAWENSNGS